MIYRTSTRFKNIYSGCIYKTIVYAYRAGVGIIVWHPREKAWRAPKQDALYRLFPDFKSAEAALKAYAKRRPGWKEVNNHA